MLMPRQASKLISALVVICLTITILGCTMNENKRNYRLGEVQIRVINDDSTQPSNTYIIFSTLMETQYYSPGVKIKRDKENNFRIEFVRAGIRDKTPAVDLKAEYLTKWLNNHSLPVVLKEKMLRKSTSAEQILVLSVPVKNIYIVDSEGEKNIWAKQ